MYHADTNQKKVRAAVISERPLHKEYYQAYIGTFHDDITTVNVIAPKSRPSKYMKQN